MKPSWSEEKVLSCAGLRPEDYTPYLIGLARGCLDTCYYIDRATEMFLRITQSRTRY